MQQARLCGLGLHPLLAASTVGTVTNNLTATGSSSQANSLLISDDVNIVTTTAANTGVRLPATLGAGDTIEVVNYGANTLNVYPPTGGKINNGTLNAAVTVATNTSALYTCIDGTNFFGVKSA